MKKASKKRGGMLSRASIKGGVFMQMLNIEQQLDRPYTCNKNRRGVLKMSIISDILMDHPSFEYLRDIKAKYTIDNEIINSYTDEECLAVFFNATLESLYENKRLKECTFLQNCISSATDVLKYITMQQKIDPTVLINYLKYIILHYEMNTPFSVRGRHHLDKFKTTDHTYNLTGKNVFGLNRSIDKVLEEIINLELKNHNLTL